MRTLICSMCRQELPETAFRPSQRFQGARCRTCHAAEERDRQRYWSGLGPAEALSEVWTRLKHGRRLPKALQRRLDRLVPQAAGAAA